jgi:hypothetical protein
MDCVDARLTFVAEPVCGQKPMSPESEIRSWEGKIELVDTIRGDKTALNMVQCPAMVARAKPFEKCRVNPLR